MLGRRDEFIAMPGSIKRDVHWLPEEDDQLRDLARAGETIANIARQLNRSPGSVRNRASRLSITVARIRKVSLSQ